MAIKLIAIDMDGTLLLPDHTISPAVKNAIAAARARGVNVVLTTGRPYAGVHNYLKELHMEQPGDEDLCTVLLLVHNNELRPHNTSQQMGRAP